MIRPIPIKRASALVNFSKEHHFSLLLVWKIRQGLGFDVDAARIGKYINFFFKNYLKDHFIEEEELLFTKLPQQDGLRLSAEKDHETLSGLNKKIKSNPDKQSIKEFSDTLETHIRFEERVLFAHLQNILEPSQLKLIAEKMAGHTPKEDNWKDIFWIKDSR